MDSGLRRPGSLEALGRALRGVREGLGLTLDEVAGKTGISKPYLSNIETGRAPGVASEEKLRKIAKALGVAEEVLVAAGDWLRTPESVRRMIEEGEGPRRGDGTRDLDAAFKKGKQIGHAQRGPRPTGHGTREGEIAVREVPVINRVAAGGAKEHGDLDYPAGVADEYVPVPDLPEAPVKSAFAVRVSGDSMMPEYGEGEIIIVGPGDAADGDDCVVRLGEGENYATTFKRVFFLRDDAGEVRGVRLVALNPKYAERVVRVEEVSGVYPLMYRVVAAKRAQATRSPAPPEAAGVRVQEGEGREITSRVSIEHD
ncbi:MAG TPA: XRE family transcriptional regulator [Phycisphaerae bacterium]|nr:XRE family transcriptional regulator [Phycisphaerae bacterium]